MALAAEPNVVFPAETSPARATSSRLAFEQAISDVMARVVARFLMDVEALGIAELDRHNAITAAIGGPDLRDKTGLIGDAKDQGVSVFVIRSAWQRITDGVVDGAVDAMLSALPLPLRWRVFEKLVRSRFLSRVDEPDIFDLAYNIIDTAVRDVTENGVSRRQAERTMREELSYLKPTGEATEFAWRAERLARTASTSLYNEAMSEQLTDDGFTHKLWVTYHDDKVRESHQQADGMSIPIEQPFIVGGYPMQQPGDTSAPIGEWINCRCVIVGENGPTTPGIDWSIPVMTQSERIEAGFPADISLAASALLARARRPIHTFGYNPIQARAPKGTRVGGQWIQTPTGLLHIAQAYQPAFEGMEDREAFMGPTLDFRASSDEVVYSPNSYGQRYSKAMGSHGNVPTDEMAQATRQALSDAAANGVHIGVSPDTLNMMEYHARNTGEEAQVLNIHDQYTEFVRGNLDTDDLSRMHDYPEYMSARNEYESNVAGANPVYGMGLLVSQNSAEQGRTFGDVTLELNDDVLDRTAWVVGDGMQGQARPLTTDEILTADAQDLIAASAWIGADPAFDPNGWQDSFDNFPYVEAQITGGVKLSDIKAVHVPIHAYNQMTPEAIRMFADAGIPIYKDRGETYLTDSVDRNWRDDWKPETPNVDFIDDDYPSSMHVEGEMEGSLMGDYVSPGKSGYYGPSNTGLRGYLNDAFEGKTFGSKDYTVEWDSGYSPSERQTDVTAKVMDPELGYQVGEIKRSYFQDGKGDWQVEHELFRMFDDDSRKTGFGTEFGRYSEEVYRDLGVKKIEVHAALENGGQTWAKAGFQWRSGTNVRLQTERVQAALDYAIVNGNTENAEKLAHYLDPEYNDGSRVVIPSDTLDTDFGTPQDVLKIPISDADSILKGSEWYGEKFDDSFWGMPGDDSVTAAGDHRDWDTSKDRSDLYFEFCTTHHVDYMGEEPWPDSMEALWVLVEEQARNMFESSWLTASGTFAVGPTQARAPKGSVIGGQWIMTPGGLLERASNPLFDIAAPGTDLPNRMSSTERVSDTYFENLPPKDKEDLAFATRLALSHAAEGGVNINVNEGELEGILDTGRFTTLRERTDAKGMDAERGGRYNEQRFGYEREIMGVPLERNTAHDPVYGYGYRKDANETDGYGDIQVRLKDDVLGRTTWTTGDSFGRRSRPIYTDEIVTGSTEDMVAGSQWAGDYIAGTKDRTELRRRRDAGGESWTQAIDRQPYFEAQVHGGVNVSDIAEIVYSEKNPPAPEVLSKLDELGIPHRPSSPAERQQENEREIDWQREFREKVDEHSNPRPPEPEPKPVEPLPDDIQKILDDIAAWEGGGRTLTAAGNPTQVRAPKGTSIGGEWIDTPGAMLDRALNTDAGATVGNPEMDTLGAYLASEFEGRTYGEGFTVKVSTPQHIVRGRSGEYDFVNVNMTVLDKNGERVGDVERQFMQGGKSVNHGEMRLSPAYRGQGFSTDFSKHSEDVYRKMGLENITLLAVQDGGRVWAKAGYQFQADEIFTVNNMSGYTGVMDHLTKTGDQDTIARLGEMFPDNIEPWMGIETNNLIKRGITPQDILNLKSSDGTPIGRDLMQDSSWQGIKHLFPVGEELGLAASGMLDDEWNTSRERSDLLFDFCTQRGLDYDAIWDDASENEWDMLDAGALVASGNPTQARGPDGRWVDTPGAMLDKAEAATPFLIGKETFPPKFAPDSIATHERNALLDPGNPAHHAEIRARVEAVNKLWGSGDRTDFGEERWLDSTYKVMGTDDATPTLVDSLTPNRDHIYRGVKHATDFVAKESKTSAEQREQFRTGDHHAGYGIYGNGSYFWRGDNHQRDAQNYSDDNGMIAGEWKPHARLYKMDTMRDAGVDMRNKMHGILGDHPVADDISATLAILGYDGMQMFGEFDPSMDIVFNRDAMNVLDRDHIYGQDATKGA